MTKADNPGFVAGVQRLVPDKGTGLILVCSGVPCQGQLRGERAAAALKAAGYGKLTVLRSGFAVRGAVARAGRFILRRPVAGGAAAPLCLLQIVR